MARNYESASSLVRFLNCPYSYRLKYVDKIEPTYKDTRRNMEFGQMVHQWFDKVGNSRDYQAAPDIIHPYLVALHNYLDDEDDEIVTTEQIIEYELGGKKLKLIVDAITKKGKALEYKVTKSPQWYENQISYQLRIYSLALKGCGIDAKPVYLLFENKSDKNAENETFTFKKLHVQYPAISELQIDLWEQEILHYLNFIEESHKRGIFPASLMNCGKCDYKADCENYHGF